MIKQFIFQNIAGGGVNFKINFQGNALAVKYGTELEFYVGSTATPYKVKQWVGTLTTNTLILPSWYVNDPNGWGFILHIVSNELALDMPRKYYFKAYVDGEYIGDATADSINSGLSFAGIYLGSCKTIEIVWTTLPTNILSIGFDKYTANTKTFVCNVQAKYPVASTLTLPIRYSESASNVYTWGTMEQGTSRVSNKTATFYAASPKCMILKMSPTYDSTYVYAHNLYANYICFHIDDCPMYGEELGHETWQDVANAIWGGVGSITNFPELTMTTEDGDEATPFKYLSDDLKTLMYMWSPESKVSTKRIETLMWEDTKYPGGTQYIYYYPDYPGTELGEEIVNKGIFLSLDLNKATMEPAKWRGPID